MLWLALKIGFFWLLAAALFAWLWSRLSRTIMQDGPKR